MHRFYIAPEDWNSDSLVLGGAEAHHARDVLRLQPGGRLVLFNGRGHEITAEIAKVTRGEILLRKMHAAWVPPLPCQITLSSEARRVGTERRPRGSRRRRESRQVSTSLQP